ncbi:predicted protein [Histoplasma mississippiense (nom. inval.)]|uniref:predicted protein n=1 Tax=Ajellomyces capsulatus (strain NAm1 / WU24) TaxID=2059318 RepID=UPI000157C6E8|nr:predicted protein [Histoplasma mississippiense (nom. inval.)]EDN08387.1 predicted protein [Histoplasma mississippiense (nom. inval.)]
MVENLATSSRRILCTVHPVVNKLYKKKVFPASMSLQAVTGLKLKIEGLFDKPETCRRVTSSGVP